MRLICVFVIAFTFDPAVAAADWIYGVKSFGTSQVISSAPAKLFRFQPGDAAVTDLGVITRIGQIDVDGLALSSSGLYGYERTGAGSNLISIDPLTAEATSIGSVLTGRDVRGAAFDRSNRLWALDSSQDQLLQVDHVNGAVIGSAVDIDIAVSDASDIAVDHNGNFMLVDDQSFHALDPFTGQTTQLYYDPNISDDGNQLANLGIAFSPEQSGGLYTFDVQEDDDVFHYDHNDGFDRTLVYGNVYLGFNSGRGDLASSVSMVPEPGALPVLGLLGGLWMLFRRRRSVLSRNADLSILRGRVVRLSVIAVIAVLVTTSGPVVQAQTYNWRNTSGNNPYWHVASNWAPTGPPGASQNANFALDDIYEVWWNNTTGDRSVSSLTLTDGEVTFLNTDSSQAAARHTLTTSNLSLFSSLAVNGIHLRSLNQTTLENGSKLTIDGTHQAGSQLTIESDFNIESATGSRLIVASAGEVSNVNARIGTTSESDGEVTITGVRSNWSNSGDLMIGGEFGSLDGRGRLKISDHASVTVAGETFITGDGGILLNGGSLVTGSLVKSGGDAFLNFDSGTLTIDGGPFLRGEESFTINGPNQPAPTLVLRNGASAALADRMTVGTSDEGRLQIESGAFVSSGLGLIARNDGSVGAATVTGAGSRWESSSLFYVGESGTGTLDIGNGGVVANNGSSPAHIAFNSTSTGTATVQGAGSQWNIDSELNVGTSGDGTLNVEAGGMVTNTDGYLGRNDNAVGSATIHGSGTQWNNNGKLFVGYEGTGELSVFAGGQVSNALNSYIGYEADAIGEATVRESGSHWNNSADVHVGYFGNGTLNVLGALVTNETGHIGTTIESTGVAKVVGSGAHWDNSELLIVGENGTGTLNVGTDGLVTSNYGIIGLQSTAVGTAVVSGSNARWNVNQALVVGESGSGTLNIQNEGSVSNYDGYLGWSSSSTAEVNVSNEMSTWSNSGDLHVGYAGIGTLKIADKGQVFSQNGFIGTGAKGAVNIQNDGSVWQNSEEIHVGFSQQGNLNVTAGGKVASELGVIGSDSSAVGTVNVLGSGSNWELSGLIVGDSGNGTLTLGSGGMVDSQIGIIGSGSSAAGAVTITGADSHWQNNEVQDIGYLGAGTLNINNGGSASTSFGRIASRPSSGSAGVGVVTVAGHDSHWENLSDLQIGIYGNGTLNVENNGRVSVGGTTSVGSGGSINLLGGRFEFGETSLGEFATINAASGSLAGNLNHTDYSDVASLAFLGHNRAVDMTEVKLTNAGTLFGHGSLGTALINSYTGEIETTVGERMRFAGSDNINSGEINNFGGGIRFDQGLTNTDTGFITGRGQFTANGGWINEGVMAFSGASADILGDVANISGGQIVTSGGAVTTFYDDVENNGLEIRTAASSKTVFFGEVSGASDFSGTGSVFFEGDLRPGNSPDIVSFGGDVIMGSFANLHLELSGVEFGAFDQLDIAGDLFLQGDLLVDLIDDFQLSANQEFIVANVDGVLDGQFNGLGEGDRVGRFGGMNLFVSYRAGDGNDVGLFTTPVPEPGILGLGAIVIIPLFLRRRRLRQAAEFQACCTDL